VCRGRCRSASRHVRQGCKRRVDGETLRKPTEKSGNSVRKFLKKLGVTAQREIEKAVRDADAKGNLSGTTLPAKAVVTVGGIDLKFEFDGDIDLA
jgi:hypothetical protein